VCATATPVTYYSKKKSFSSHVNPWETADLHFFSYQPDTSKLQNNGYGANALCGVPVYPMLLLVLIALPTEGWPG